MGRVARDDVEAVRAINGEVRDLMLAMERGLKNLDVETVREAANKARSLAGMLSPEAAEKAQVAIAVAHVGRTADRQGRETGAVAVDEAVLRRYREVELPSSIWTRLRNSGRPWPRRARLTWSCSRRRCRRSWHRCPWCACGAWSFERSG